MSRASSGIGLKRKALKLSESALWRRRLTALMFQEGVITMALPVRRRSNEVRSWDPFQELDDLQHRFSSLLESTAGDLSGSSFGSWTPAVDIEETDDAFVVEAELPGVKREDVNIELNENQLVVHGEIKERERSGVLRRQ